MRELKSWTVKASHKDGRHIVETVYARSKDEAKRTFEAKYEWNLLGITVR